MTNRSYVEVANEDSLFEFAHALQDRDFEVTARSCGDSGMAVSLDVPALDLTVDNVDHLDRCPWCRAEVAA